MGIWQDLVDSHGFVVDAMKRAWDVFCAGSRGSATPGTVVMIETLAGEVCRSLNDGTWLMGRDPVNGKLSAHAAVCSDAGL